MTERCIARGICRILFIFTLLLVEIYGNHALASSRNISDTSFKIVPNGNKKLSVILPVLKKDEHTVLRFNVRAAHPAIRKDLSTLGGWAEILTITVNGQQASLWTPALSPRLMNKPIFIWPQGDDYIMKYFHNLYVRNGRWVVFYANDFVKYNADDPYWPMEGNPFEYVIDITDLVKRGKNIITLANNSKKATLIFVNCHIKKQLRHTNIILWRKEKPLPVISSENRISVCTLDYTNSKDLSEQAIKFKANHFPLIIDNYDKTMMSHDINVVAGIGAKFRKVNPDCRIIRYYCPQLPFWTYRTQPINQCEDVFEHLIPNWGFEDGSDHWEIVNGKIVSGIGRNKSKALEFDFSEGKEGWARSVPIKTSANRGVKITAWIKTENVTGEGAGIFIEFYKDKQGTIPLVSKQYKSYKIYSKPITGTHDWFLYHLGEWTQQYHSKPLISTPKGTHSIRIGVYMRGKGRAIFDDIGRVQQLDYQPSCRYLSNVDWFNTMPNWGSPKFHEFIKKELQYMWNKGAEDGIFLDQVFPAIIAPPNVLALPYDYSLKSYRNKVIGLLKDITAFHDKHGKILVANMPIEPWGRFIFLPYVHGVLLEKAFSRRSSSEEGGFPDEDIWKMQMNAILRGEQEYPNRIFVPMSFVNPTDRQLRIFVLASYLLTKGKYCYLATGIRDAKPFVDAHVSIDDWLATYRPEFDIALGKAVSQLSPVNGTNCDVYTRKFENGQVFVNAGSDKTYPINITKKAETLIIYDTSMKNMAGKIRWNSISKLFLASKRAAIIRWKQ